MWNPFNRNTISNASASKRSLQLITQKGMPFAYVDKQSYSSCTYFT